MVLEIAPVQTATMENAFVVMVKVTHIQANISLFVYGVKEANALYAKAVTNALDAMAGDICKIYTHSLTTYKKTINIHKSGNL